MMGWMPEPDGIRVNAGVPPVEVTLDSVFPEEATDNAPVTATPVEEIFATLTTPFAPRYRS